MDPARSITTRYNFAGVAAEVINYAKFDVSKFKGFRITGVGSVVAFTVEKANRYTTLLYVKVSFGT
jgi:hypothetical protein